MHMVLESITTQLSLQKKALKANTTFISIHIDYKTFISYARIRRDCNIAPIDNKGNFNSSSSCFTSNYRTIQKGPDLISYCK